MEPRVGVVIVNWNGLRDTLACLASLDRTDPPPASVYVVDNGSREDDAVGLARFLQGSSGRATRCPVTLMTTGENLGFAGGTNVGMARALADGCTHVLMLNNDTLVAPEFLAPLLAAVTADPRVGIAGPAILFAERDDAGQWRQGQRVWFGGGRVKWLGVSGTPEHHSEPYARIREDPVHETDFITGCCLLVTRELVDRIGPMRDDFFLYFEDTEWCLRARANGFRVILVPQSHIWHKISQSTREGSAIYVYYNIRNSLRMAWNLGGATRRCALAGFALWLAAKQFAKLAIPSKRPWARAALAGIADAIRGRAGRLSRTI